MRSECSGIVNAFIDSPTRPPMMPADGPFPPRGASVRPYNRSLAGDVCLRPKPTRRPKPKMKAEGATAPETLRQKDREGDELLESGAAFAASTEGVTPRRLL